MKIVFFVILNCFSFCFLFSQERVVDSIKISELKEVVVTATRTERNLASLPLPTSIITSEAISKSGVSRLNEILFATFFEESSDENEIIKALKDIANTYNYKTFIVQKKYKKEYKKNTLRNF